MQSVLLVSLLAVSGFVLRYHLRSNGPFDALMTPNSGEAIVKEWATRHNTAKVVGLLPLYRRCPAS